MRTSPFQKCPSSGTVRLLINVHRLRGVWRAVNLAKTSHVHFRVVVADLASLRIPKGHEWNSDPANQDRSVLPQIAASCALAFTVFLIQPVRHPTFRSLPPLRQRRPSLRRLESGVSPKQPSGNVTAALVTRSAPRQHSAQAGADLTFPLPRPTHLSVHQEAPVSLPQLGLVWEGLNSKLPLSGPAAPSGLHQPHLLQHLPPNLPHHLAALQVIS
jgi:hypothetical protein